MNATAKKVLYTVTAAGLAFMGYWLVTLLAAFKTLTEMN